MAPAPSASGLGRHLLPLVLIAMILLVAAFIVLTAYPRGRSADAVQGALSSNAPKCV